MARRRRFSRKRKRPRTLRRRKFRRGRPKLRIQRKWFKSTAGLPTRLSVKFKYREYFNAVSATNATGAYVFRLNSLYDPNQTGIGNQPRYYDQLCSADLYQSVNVNYVVMKVTFINQVTTDAQIGVHLSDSAIKLYNFANDLFYGGEQAFTVIRQLEGASPTSTKSITMKIAPRRFFGIRRQGAVFGSDVAHGWNGNPAVVLYAHVYSSCLAGASDGANVQYQVQFTYYATLYNLANEVPQS